MRSDTGSAPALEPGPEETLDSICGGQVELLQRRDGYRFNLDPILLAHFAQEAPQGLRGPTIDLCAGSGIIALILARKFGRSELAALELQPSLCDLARRNVQRNRAAGQVTVVQGDLRQLPAESTGGAAQVICNPPYGAAGGGRINPNAERAIARHELQCSLDDVARAASELLREHGGFSIIYPASRLCALIESLRHRRLEPKLLRMVHPRAGASAKRVLVQAIKGGGPQLEVLPPLWIHQGTGAALSDEVKAMVG